MPLAGCVDGPETLQVPVSDDTRPWTPVRCDPHPRDRIPVNAHPVPALTGFASEVAPRVAAALGEDPASRPEPTAWSVDGHAVTGSRSGWDTPGGRLTHTPLLFGPGGGATYSAVIGMDGSAEDTTEAGGTWVHEGTTASIANETALEATLRTLYQELGADPDSLRFELWVADGTSHAPHRNEAYARVHQQVGNHTTHSVPWVWNVEEDGNVTLRRSVGPLYRFDGVAWMDDADLLERLRQFTECLLADDPAFDPDGVEYRLQDAFVVGGTTVVEATVSSTGGDCPHAHLFTTYLDAQAGVVYETPRAPSAACPEDGSYWN